MIYTRISGTGSQFGSRKVTNTELSQLSGVDNEWVTARTGIECRHILADGEDNLSLALKACERAIESSGIKKEKIDLLIVATVTAENRFPSTSNLLQAKLGLGEVMSFDINAACSGFIYALNIADKMIKSGAYNNALIVGSDSISKIVDWNDKKTSVLFGDAAGAMIIERSGKNNIKEILCASRGDTDGLLYSKNISPRNPDVNKPELQDTIHMQGRPVFRFASKIIQETILELLKRSNLSLGSVDKIVLHQANKRIIESGAQLLGVDMDKMFVNIENHGNTSAASVPLALDQAVRCGEIKRGDIFATAAFGGGLSWGGALIKY
jgi:3-oxoacyl-[acyl-carrier-protein] synthase-3